MAHLANDSSRLVLGRRWDDGFINQRLLGLGVAVFLTGAVVGFIHLIA